MYLFIHYVTGSQLYIKMQICMSLEGMFRMVTYDDDVDDDDYDDYDDFVYTLIEL